MSIYGDEYETDSADWCDEHAVPRETCRCPWDDAPRGLASRLLDRSQLATLPEPSPLIAATIDRRTVAVLAGYWGTGKSFLALDWGASTATGRPWQGRVTESGHVLYVASEGAHGLDQRLRAWESAWQRTIDPQSFHVLPVPVQFANEKQVRDLRSITRDLAPTLLIVDTVARCAVGLDENSAKDMGQFVDVLYRLRDDTADGTVLAVHHTGKDRSTIRGSSAIEAGVDTVYQIEGDPSLLKLSRTKRKDGPTIDEHTLRLEPIPGTGSVVISASQDSGSTPSAEALLSHYNSHFASLGGATSAALKAASAMADTTYYRALNHLVSQGILVNAGTKARPFYTRADQ